MTTRPEREAILREADWNPFRIRADDILIDLLTDSGTGAMSAAQWGALMEGDESYAGSRSWYRFEETVRNLTGHDQVIPTHQGRAAERILFQTVDVAGKTVPNNGHFDTTRANIEAEGGRAVDIPCPEADDPASDFPFKGNIDLEALEDLIEREGPENVPLCLITITNNTGGGQPVSLENLREARAICDRWDIPLFLDACRFAENAWLVREREDGQGDRSVREVAREMFRHASGCTFSAKKDGLANIGGFLVHSDPDLARTERNLLVLTEGFPTYGGMAGRDLEAITVGLREVLDEAYLEYRCASVRYLAERIEEAGVPIVRPPGGHAVYVDAGSLLPHVPPERLPGQSLVCALYLEGGIRSVEIGTLMFGRTDEETGEPVPAPRELVRLALPRRVYTQSHVDYVGEIVARVADRRHDLGGLEIVKEEPVLRHFTARLRPTG